MSDRDLSGKFAGNNHVGRGRPRGSKNVNTQLKAVQAEAVANIVNAVKAGNLEASSILLNKLSMKA